MCRIIRGRGSFRRGASRRSTECAVGRGSTPRSANWPNGSIHEAAQNAPDEEGVEDDQLRLIFTCCHPALAPEHQVALTLREVCGLATEAIASAFLVTPATLAQRIVRAKAKIRDAGIPYQVPDREDLPERMETVLQVVYLVFNEGYSASSGESLTRPDLSGEAIRLGRLLLELLPEPEVIGLLALMLLHESRRAARTSPTGELVLLDDQDRSLWDREQIAEGEALVRRAMGSAEIGPYVIQAAIAAVHAAADSARVTDWAQIVALYDLFGARRFVTRHRAESGRRNGHARWPCGRPTIGRRDSRPRRFDRLSPGLCGAGRSLPSLGPDSAERGPLMSRPWRSCGRSRNGGFSSGG